MFHTVVEVRRRNIVHRTWLVDRHAVEVLGSFMGWLNEYHPYTFAQADVLAEMVSTTIANWDGAGWELTVRHVTPDLVPFVNQYISNRFIPSALDDWARYIGVKDAYLN